MMIFHDARCVEYGSSMRPEQPARIATTVPRLQAAHPDWRWITPAAFPTTAELSRGHTPALLKRLQQPRDFDDDTPFFPGIFEHAGRAVAAALGAVDAVMATGTGPAISLMRPPGHHATASQAMGFCYLNSVALAALAAQAKGAARVAVWDFDAHHGNGTEAILEGRPGFLFSSVHQYPGYPGTGTRDTATARNWPVAPHTPAKIHLTALEQSWQAVLAFKPEVVLVSAGFDAYVDDPITAMTLEPEHFAKLGTWLRQAALPCAAVLEGGYSPDLPVLIDEFLSAWAGPRPRSAN